MGSLHARVFAEEVREGTITLDAALDYHLTANHFPPIGRAMIPIAKLAIEKGNAGEFDALIELPEGMSIKGRTDNMAPALTLITNLHLEAFLDREDDSNGD